MVDKIQIPNGWEPVVVLRHGLVSDYMADLVLNRGDEFREIGGASKLLFKDSAQKDLIVDLVNDASSEELDAASTILLCIERSKWPEADKIKNPSKGLTSETEASEKLKLSSKVKEKFEKLACSLQNHDYFPASVFFETLAKIKAQQKEPVKILDLVPELKTEPSSNMTGAAEPGIAPKAREI